MGLRGPHAKPAASYSQPLDELIPKGISSEAVRIYRRMRTLERQCECTEDTIYDTRCFACVSWWEQNAALNKELGTFAFGVYTDPAWGHVKFQQSAVDRFHLLQAAASKANKKRTFKYKWER